jgi:hypothetical protein
MIHKPPKPKTCTVCKTSFTPARMGMKVCSPFCAMTFAKSVTGKAAKVAAVKDRRETKVKLDKLKSRAAWAKEAQTAFNFFIRLRDADQPCISCGRHHQGQYHAGHYLSVGARPELRFEELNVHKQCAPCNTHLSGNAVLFRKALLEKLGVELVEWLEGPHKPSKYTIDDLKTIKVDYAAEAAALKKAQA